MKDEEVIQLLRDILALHGLIGYGGKVNGLVERGKLYLETEDGKIRKYANHVDAGMMQEIDDRIIKILEDIKRTE